MIDLGTGNNNKINWALEDKQEFIDIVETVFRGARKGRGLVVSPKVRPRPAAGGPTRARSAAGASGREGLTGTRDDDTPRAGDRTIRPSTGTRPGRRAVADRGGIGRRARARAVWTGPGGRMPRDTPRRRTLPVRGRLYFCVILLYIMTREDAPAHSSVHSYSALLCMISLGGDPAK